MTDKQVGAIFNMTVPYWFQLSEQEAQERDDAVNVVVSYAVNCGGGTLTVSGLQYAETRFNANRKLIIAYAMGDFIPMDSKAFRMAELLELDRGYTYMEYCRKSVSVLTHAHKICRMREFGDSLKRLKNEGEMNMTNGMEPIWRTVVSKVDGMVYAQYTYECEPWPKWGFPTSEEEKPLYRWNDSVGLYVRNTSSDAILF